MSHGVNARLCSQENIYNARMQDLLAEFQGKWVLRPVRNEAGEVVRTESELTQHVLPKGAPNVLTPLLLIGHGNQQWKLAITA